MAGSARDAALLDPAGVAVAPNGDVYISDTGHLVVRKVEARSGIISTVAGDGQSGPRDDDGTAVRVHLAAPAGLALGADGIGGRVCTWPISDPVPFARFEPTAPSRRWPPTRDLSGRLALRTTPWVG